MPVCCTSPVLVANGAVRWTPALAGLAAAARPLLAADGGADHLAKLGLLPAAVIGDLDSISARARAWIGEERMVQRPDQDRTDLEKAIQYVFEEYELDRLTVLGALGGRPDHAIGNLGLLARLGRGEAIRFLDEASVTIAVHGAAELEAEPGETWSFLAFDPTVKLSLSGVKWPLDDAPVDVGDRPSISNLATEERVRIEATGGPVVVMRFFLS